MNATPNHATPNAGAEWRPLYSLRLARELDLPYERLAARQVCSPDDAAPMLRRYFADKPQERFAVVLLDTANHVTGIVEISVGGLAAAIVEARAVFAAALAGNAAAVLLAHNHPSGNPEPSREDVAITRQLVEAGRVLGIPVRDHLIIAAGAPGGYTSLATRGLI